MTTLLVLLALSGLASLDEPRFTEHLVATMPEGAALEGASFMDPNWQRLTPKRAVGWSSDGSQVAYVAHLDGGVHPVIGDVVGPAFDIIDPPVFGGSGPAFRAGSRDGKDRELWWIWRGEESIEELGKPRDWIGAIALSPVDGEAVYWTQPRAKEISSGSYYRGSQALHSPWKQGGQWDDADSLVAPLFDADGDHVYTAAMRGSEWFALTIDKRGEHHSKRGYSAIEDMVLHPDGDDVALVVPDFDPRRGGVTAGAASQGFGAGDRKCVVQVGKRSYGANFESAGCPAYSPDGKHLAYKVKQDGRYGVVVGDEEQPVAWHDFVTTPVFAPKGKRLAYVANEGNDVEFRFSMKLSGDLAQRTGDEQVVTRDRKGKQVESGEYFQRVEGLAWSPDGELLAFAARDEDGWRVHAGEVVSEPYEHIGPLHFSKDGKQLAFGALSGREFWWRVLELEPE